VDAPRWNRSGGLFGVAVAAVGLGFVGASEFSPSAGLAVLLALGRTAVVARAARLINRTVAWGLALQFVFALIVLKDHSRTDGISSRRAA
jgi:hypothetical protein